MDNPTPLPGSGIAQPKREKEGWGALWKASRIKIWHLILGLILCALFLWLAFRSIPLESLSSQIGQSDWTLVLFTLFVSILGTLARAIRWRFLYYPNQNEVNYFQLSRVLFISQMLNILIPARLGELARLYLMRPVKAGRTLGTIAVEKALDVLTLFSFVLVLPLALSLPAWFNSPGQNLGLITLFLILTGTLLYFGKERLAEWLQRVTRHFPENLRLKVNEFGRNALQGLEVFRSPKFVMWLLFWSLVIWGLGAVQNYILFKAVNLALPFSASIFLLLVLQVGISVPSTPGKIGVFQYLCIMALAVFGVSRETALAYSLVLYLASFGPHILLGMVFGIWEWTQKNHQKNQLDKPLPSTDQGLIL